MSNNLQVINNAIMQQESRFNAVLADPSISFQREAGFAYQVISQNSFAASTAMNNMQSLVDEFHRCPPHTRQDLSSNGV